MGDYKIIEPKKVTLKNKAHLMFALEYLRTLDGAGSYRAVYEKPGKPMGDTIARAGASRILAIEEVQDYMDYIIYSELDIAGRVGVNPGRVIIELVKVAYEASYKNPSVKVRALELLGRAIGILGDGEMYDGLDRARQRQIEEYSKRMYEREIDKVEEVE